MILGDPMKELNKQKYLNDVAMKYRYDMLYINKVNSKNGKCAQGHYYRNYPSPCRDEDLLAFRFKATKGTLQSYIKHMKVVTDTIDNSHIIYKLNSIDQTSAIRMRMDTSNERKKATVSTLVSQNNTTVSTLLKKRLAQRGQHKAKKKKKLTNRSTDKRPHKKESLPLEKIRKEKMMFPLIKIPKSNAIVLPKEVTPILCTESTVDNLLRKNNEANPLFEKRKSNDTVHTFRNPHPILMDETNQCNGKKTIPLSQLVPDDEETVISPLKPSPLKHRIKIRLSKAKRLALEHLEPTNLQIKQETMKDVSCKEHKKYAYYDNFLINKNEGSSPYPKHHVLKNYLFKKNNRVLAQTDQSFKLLQAKISKTFQSLNNDVTTTIDWIKTTEDLY